MTTSTALFFDLIVSPWIRIMMSDGNQADLGIREALLSAHEISAIIDPTPTIEFGLYRLLGAIVLDALKPVNLRELDKIIAKGKFDAAVIEQYFADHRGRFNLFDPVHPFLQTGKMEGARPKPLAGLLPAVPSGTNAMHFHRMHEGEFGVSPAAAARLLTTISPFMTAGGAGLSPSINGAPPWYTLVLGDTLFETITRNLFVLPDEYRAKLGVPAWRRIGEVNAERCKTFTYLEALTWQPRRIQLIPGEGGRCALTGADCDVLVREMRFEPGASCDFDLWRDPNVAYRELADKRTPLRAQEGREVWRDTAPLALLNHHDYKSGHDEAKGIRFSRPRIVDQFAGLVGNQSIPSDQPLRLKIYGKRTDMKMKVFEWFSESLTVPGALVWNSSFHLEAQKQIDVAGLVAAHLKRTLRDALGEGVLEAEAIAIERNYWITLRQNYDALLGKMAAIDPEEPDFDFLITEVVSEWKSTLLEAALDEFDRAVDITDIGASGRYLLAATRARAGLRRKIVSALGLARPSASIQPVTPAEGAKVTA